MIVTLIPFFLAANITANVGDWKNGPEVIYDATINYLNYQLENIDRTFVDNVTMKFKCRPKTESRLSCRIQENSTSSFVLINDKKEGIRASSGDSMGSPFELDFDSHGLREIVVDKPSFGGLMNDIVKSLAEQLNIGADLPSRAISVFSIAENSTTGQCQTDYVISSGRSNNDFGKEKKKSYEILIVPTMRGVRRGEVNEIKRSISAIKCPYRYQYYKRDGNEVGHDLNERTDPPKFFYESELKSSKTRMTIMESNYTAHTEDEMIIINLEQKSTARRVKKTMIKLYEIVPAEGPLPKINNPMTVNRFWRERQHQ